MFVVGWCAAEEACSGQESVKVRPQCQYPLVTVTGKEVPMPRATDAGEAKTYASLDWLKLILSLAIV